MISHLRLLTHIPGQLARTSLTYLWAHLWQGARLRWSISPKTKKLHVPCKSCTMVHGQRILPTEPAQSEVDHSRLTTLCKKMCESCSMANINRKLPGQMNSSDLALDELLKLVQIKSQSVLHRQLRLDVSESAALLKLLVVSLHPQSTLPLAAWEVLACGKAS